MKRFLADWTANFAINTYTLTYTAGPNGTVSGLTGQTVNYGGSGSAVTAVPNTGYQFVNWSDGSTANPRTDGNVKASLSVTANFGNGSLAAWTAVDIGSPGRAGTVTSLGGSLKVSGAGNISGTADNFYFVYQILTANGEIRARLNLNGGPVANARAGVMIRESLTTRAKCQFVGLDGANGYKSSIRTSPGGSTTVASSGTGTAPYIWVRVVRYGDRVTTYKSSNGTTWTPITATNVSMAVKIYLGLAVASGSTTALNTAVFDNLMVVH